MNAFSIVRRALVLSTLPLVLALSAPDAQAQRLSIGIGKHGHHGSINFSAGINFGLPLCNAPIRVTPPNCAPPVWLPGHYENIERKVFVPGCVRQEYVPPVYEERYWRDYCGRVHVERIQTCPATWRTVQDPGTWKCVTERVWIEGSWLKHAY